MPVVDPPAAVSPRLRFLSQRAVTVTGALFFATAVCLAIFWARRRYTGHWGHLFMVWNLMLAWIPMLFAFATYRVHRSGTKRRLLFAFCALTWFFFFPNAPYIITDFVHLDFNYNPVLLWIDLFNIASFAWTGLCLGYVSLCLMQEIVTARYGRTLGWFFVLGMLALGSLGIYMGRVLRWNSWDVLRHPTELFKYGRNDHQDFVQPEMKTFLLLMFLFLLLSYGTLYALAQLHQKEPA